MLLGKFCFLMLRYNYAYFSGMISYIYLKIVLLF